jgi:transposase InsO family protein
VAVAGQDLGVVWREKSFGQRAQLKEVRTAYRSPWQNPFVERFIGTLRRELDHVLVLSQGHLERLLREFIEDYYHIALRDDGPIPSWQVLDQIVIVPPDI